jgi:hypothetical protein
MQCVCKDSVRDTKRGSLQSAKGASGGFERIYPVISHLIADQIKACIAEEKCFHCVKKDHQRRYSPNLKKGGAPAAGGK